MIVQRPDGTVVEQPGLADLKLVALTGYGRELDRLRALSARFQELGILQFEHEEPSA